MRLLAFDWLLAVTKALTRSGAATRNAGRCISSTPLHVHTHSTIYHPLLCSQPHAPAPAPDVCPAVCGSVPRPRQHSTKHAYPAIPCVKYTPTEHHTHCCIPALTCRCGRARMRDKLTRTLIFACSVQILVLCCAAATQSAAVTCLQVPTSRASATLISGLHRALAPTAHVCIRTRNVFVVISSEFLSFPLHRAACL